MKHYWINLEKNELRRNFMLEQFNKNNIENYRINAIIPDDFNNCLVEKRPLTCKYPGCNTCEYEYACLCSHIKAMQEGIKSGDDYFIILEDDIYLPFIIDYKELIKSIPRDTEILQMLILYGHTVTNLYHLYDNEKNLFIKWCYLLPSTGMYLISREGAIKLVKQFYNENIKKYDFTSSPHQIVADVLLYKTAITYATTVPYCRPEIKMGSDIHPDHLKNHNQAIIEIKEVQNNYEKFPFIISLSK